MLNNSTPETISQLTSRIKSLLESDISLKNVFACGEISNLTMHSSGHIYFRLKDEKSIINAVMFRSSASTLKFRPENGMKVIVKGRIGLFEPSGNYQIYVNFMQPDGIGDLYVAFEQLKNKLQKEGLFDEIYKKRIPKIATKIGVITSPTGAAVRDIINIISRRFPLAKIELFPALVQGEGSALSLVHALKIMDKRNYDVIIIGRGGGSIEDLWSFNDENLAREIFNCQTPMISAVGHETDFTICDFVSDLRAPTPSAAAELSVPDSDELIKKFDNVCNRLCLLLKKQVEIKKEKLNHLDKSEVFNNVTYMTDLRQMKVDKYLDNLLSRMLLNIKNSTNDFVKVVSKLDALSPLNILKRGYLFAEDNSKKIIKSVDDLTVDENVNLTLPDGKTKCKVLEISKGVK